MSLHGTVQINGRVIATWSAQRITNTEGTPRPEQVSTYRCAVVPQPNRDVDNFPLDRQFDLDHQFGDGFARLAARVLDTYADAARCPAHGVDEPCPTCSAYIAGGL